MVTNVNVKMTGIIGNVDAQGNKNGKIDTAEEKNLFSREVKAAVAEYDNKLRNLHQTADKKDNDVTKLEREWLSYDDLSDHDHYSMGAGLATSIVIGAVAGGLPGAVVGLFFGLLGGTTIGLAVGRLGGTVYAEIEKSDIRDMRQEAENLKQEKKALIDEANRMKQELGIE